jgi:Ca2+-binding EF-hand superfamily protein
MQKENDPQMPITSQEEKEIHRVFELLCDYNQKSRIKEEIKELNSWLIATKAKISQQINAGHIIIDEKIEANNLTTIARLDELKKELQEIENKADKKITAVDIAEKLRRLKKQATKKEIEEMLWEVDENLDGCIDWAEFRLMYNRNIMDKTGLEPSRMVIIATL